MSIIGGWPRPCARTALRALPHRTFYSAAAEHSMYKLVLPDQLLYPSKELQSENEDGYRVNFVDGWTHTDWKKLLNASYSKLRRRLSTSCRYNSGIFGRGSFSSPEQNSQYF